MSANAHTFIASTLTTTEPAKLELLTTMVAVGRVSPTSVRMWARLDGPSRIHLELDANGDSRRPDPWTPELGEGGTLAFSYPDEFAEQPPLAPGTAYHFRLVTDTGVLVGEGSFKTPPAQAADAPTRWS